MTTKIMTDLKMNSSLHKLTDIVANLMRTNNVKRGAGTWEEYYRAIDIAEEKMGMTEGIRERIYRWILPR